MSDKARAGTLRPAQVRHLLRATHATSRHPERDVLLLGITCAMRVTEIAQIVVADVLLPFGALRPEVSLRAAITKGCRQRCVFVTHRLAIEALDAYIEHRWRLGHGTELNRTRFRGLSPETALILSCRGSAFSLTVKPRLLADGTSEGTGHVMPCNSTSPGSTATLACTTVPAIPGGEHSPHAWLAKGTTSRLCSGFSGMRTSTTRMTIWM